MIRVVFPSQKGTQVPHPTVKARAVAEEDTVGFVYPAIFIVGLHSNLNVVSIPVNLSASVYDGSNPLRRDLLQIWRLLSSAVPIWSYQPALPLKAQQDKKTQRSYGQAMNRA